MKHKKMFCIFFLEAAVCILFGLLHIRFSGIFSMVAAVPFEQIGYGLRILSLSGPVGNAAAVILYILLSLIPFFIYCLLRIKGRDNRVDLLLAGLSILLFFVLYYMVNPGLLQMSVPESAKWMPGAVFDSALFGYLILRALRVYISADVRRLQQGLLRLLWVLNMIFVYAVCGKCFGELLSSVQALRSMGQGMEMGMGLPGANLSLMMSYFFLVLQFLVNALPYLLDLLVVCLAVRVIEAFAENRYSDQAVMTAAKLAHFCAESLAVTAAASVLFNILQFAFGSRLYQVNVTVVVPVVSVIFVLAILLLARYIQEDQKLKQDNDLFI